MSHNQFRDNAQEDRSVNAQLSLMCAPLENSGVDVIVDKPSCEQALPRRAASRIPALQAQGEGPVIGQESAHAKELIRS